jgi:hypothetical protein
MFTISQLHIYPVKSLAGIAVDSATLTERGFAHDRRWMLIDANNQFLTQRECGALALLDTALGASYLEIRHRLKPDLGTLQVPFAPNPYEQLQVPIWDDVCKALALSRDADAWLSEALGQAFRLVYLPDDSPRQVDPDRVNIPLNVSFADAYPYLLIGESSLADLNQRLAEPVSMNRFRPNIVFAGGAAFQEDSWQELLMGGVPFQAIKPCGRCILTTTDQETGLRHSAGEPLKTLASYRSKGNKVLFGMNLITQTQGTLKVGDEILVG